MLADVIHWPRWLPTVSEVKHLDTLALAIGSRYRITQPRLRPAVWMVSSIDPPNHFSWISDSPGVRVTAHHRLVALPEGKSRVELEIVIEGWLGPVASLLFGRVTRSYLRFEAFSLQRRFETAGKARL